MTDLCESLSKSVTSDGAADTSAPGKSSSSTPPGARGAAVTPALQTRRARPRLHPRPRQEELRSHPSSRHDRQREGTPGRRGHHQKVLQTKSDTHGTRGSDIIIVIRGGPSVHLLKCPLTNAITPKICRVDLSTLLSSKLGFSIVRRLGRRRKEGAHGGGGMFK